MASKVSIVNGGLRLLGSNRITSFAEDSEGAILANEFYDDIRDRVLRAHPWNFAVKRTSLPALAATPAWEFTYAYNVPADSLRMLEIEGQDFWHSKQSGDTITGLGWRLESGQILTDKEPPLNIRYIRQETDPNQYDANFISALEARIALEFAEKLTGTSAKVADMASLYDKFLRDARAVNGQEGTARPLIVFDWLLARRS